MANDPKDEEGKGVDPLARLPFGCSVLWQLIFWGKLVFVHFRDTPSDGSHPFGGHVAGSCSPLCVELDGYEPPIRLVAHAPSVEMYFLLVFFGDVVVRSAPGILLVFVQLACPLGILCFWSFCGDHPTLAGWRIYKGIYKQGWPRLAKLYKGTTIMPVISVSLFFLVASVEMLELGVKIMCSQSAFVKDVS
ncbi:unnamed protein product [Sphenostylis stenocarpa]|uniref:Uncharacterized protein n=1 Tax=Sphenostylis stenocarpa TaxID=92480 RepID=A0AA86RV52_9FABA|nr:unnamed protein product [Sphenostylis stenocarpa]